MDSSKRYSLYRIPITLHDALEQYARIHLQSVKAAKQTLLQQAFAALDPQPSLKRIERYLSHADIQMPVIDKHESALDLAFDERLKTIAATWSRIAARTIQRRLVLQALLWDQLTPDAPRTRPLEPRTAQTQTSITIRIPETLNIELLAVALQRDIGVAQLIDELLANALNTIQEARAHGQLLLPDLVLQQHIPDASSYTTARLSRVLDGRLRDEEVRWREAGYGWRKTMIIGVLLWNALATQQPVQPRPPKDQNVLVDGALYARVHTQMIHQRRAAGRTISMREMIRRYVEQGVARDEATAAATAPHNG